MKISLKVQTNTLSPQLSTLSYDNNTPLSEPPKIGS